MTKAAHKDGLKRFLQFKKIQLTIPVTHKITDFNREEIQGSFYERELQKTSQDVFRIEKALKRRGDKSLVNGWDIMIRLISGLIIKTLEPKPNVCN